MSISEGRKRSLANLKMGKGRKPKPTKSKSYTLKVDELHIPIIEEIALQYGCIWGGKPWIGGLLQKIGKRELLVVPAPPRKRDE